MQRERGGETGTEEERRGELAQRGTLSVAAVYIKNPFFFRELKNGTSKTITNGKNIFKNTNKRAESCW